MKNRIHIFAGHFGSGKTELALNFAVNEANKGKKVTMIDLDTVNPYFRTNDAREILTKEGIEVLAPEYANSNLDMPTLPQGVERIFSESDGVAVFDVGGDEDGAYALGGYKKLFEGQPYQMYMVVNTKRPMTETTSDLLNMAKMIENASRLHFTDIVNNTNLGMQTRADTLLSDYEVIQELSESMNIPISMQCGLPAALEKLPPDEKKKQFQMRIFIKMPWEL